MHSDAPCIFVTHDREEAVTLGNRIALMSEGSIVETGTGTELFLAPKTEFAARFFGQGAVLPCRILEKNEDGTKVLSPIGILTIPLPRDYNPLSPLLYIPRDAVSLEEAPASAARKSFSGRAAGTRFEGSGMVVTILPETGQNSGEGIFPAEPVPIEAGAGPRIKAPLPGGLVTFQVDQSLLKFLL